MNSQKNQIISNNLLLLNFNPYSIINKYIFSLNQERKIKHKYLKIICFYIVKHGEGLIKMLNSFELFCEIYFRIENAWSIIFLLNP